MAYAVKIKTRVQAWELGAGTDRERDMIRQKKIVAHPDGTYELFSQEATGEKGQMAKAGDYFKVDDRGFPYPNERAFFLQSHRHLTGDWYEQLVRPVKFWRKGDPVCEEIRFLMDRGILRVHPEDPKRYFSAFLWGTEETAPEDAVIVFFSVEKDAAGSIAGVEFNFVVSYYFQQNYRVLPS